MIKSKGSPGGFPDLMSNPFALADAASRTQTFWAAQAAALDHVRAYVDGWCERRQDAAASAAECCAEVFDNGGDPSATPRALTNWMSGSAERLREDLQAQATLAIQLAGSAAAYSANGAKPRKRRGAVDRDAGDAEGRARSTPAEVR